MSLLALGINYKTATAPIRERFLFTPQQTKSALLSLADACSIDEAVILSTCHRTELYCASVDKANITRWLCHYHSLAPQQLTDVLYSHEDCSAVWHLMRVASGLDSMLIGEPQILGQLKDAYRLANEAGTMSKHFQRLFQDTFAAAKAVRTKTNVGANPVSLAYCAVKLAERIFSSLTQARVLLIGAGETISLLASHLQTGAIGQLLFTNRTREKAELLAKRYAGQVVDFHSLDTTLAQADIIFSATHSQVPIVEVAALKHALKARKHKPIVIIDMAMPRDVAPEVGELDDIYLYSVDDLEGMLENNRALRHAEAFEAEKIIQQYVNSFMRWVHSLQAVGLIRTYRAQANAICDAQINKAKAQLASGQTPEDVLAWLAKSITSKIIHEPTIQLREASLSSDPKWLDIAKQVLGLHRDNKGSG